MSERRDYRAEIKAAAEAGDVMGLLMLATELAARAEHDDERREKEASRKRRVRGHPRTSPDVPSVDRTVAQPPPMVSPYKPLPFPPLSVAESAARESARMALGEEFSDVEQFVESREGRTRGAWWREIAKLLTSGATAEDMAGACRDGQAVDPPLGGPYALRAFIGKRKLERNRPPPGVGGGGAPRRTGGVGARTYANALEALEDL